MGKVLVVDDERSMREFLAICLKREGHDVSVVASGDEAVVALEVAPVDVVITDLRMPGSIDGLGVLEAVIDSGAPTEVVVVTAFATPETAIAAMKRGAYDYLTKPFKVDEINAVIDRALEKRALVEANVALREKVSGRYRLASLIGKSSLMQRVFELINKIHSTMTNVLITGESGTGKELVARALHTEGSRADGPFVAVNCGAIPADLMESELFGHIKGAFTGANRDRDGLFVGANGGTLFLDEIAELSLALQVKLLRALQERKVRRVGATDETAIDVRVVAATNRDLEEEVEAGGFRSDLFFRLNVIEVRIPPLRQRTADVPLLINHFIRRFAAQQNKRITGIDAEATRQLEGYHFPGNVRELENIIERAVTLASGTTLTTVDLPPLKKAPAMRSGPDVLPDDGLDLDSVLADYERGIITAALGKSGGVRKRAASFLGISFRSLRYRLKKLGLDGGDAGDSNGQPEN